jgi:type I restriction enzyme, S subunit
MSFPRYPKYKPSGVEWLGEVPEGWEVARLKNVIVQKITDGPHTTPNFYSDGIPFLSVDGIQDGELQFDGCRFISKEDHEEFRKKALPRKGDLLLGKAASTGKLARVKVDFEFSIWSPLALIRFATTKANPAFFEQWLKSPIAQAQIDNLCTSNTQKNISMDDIPRLIVTIPPLPEQTAIAEFLDRETGKIDGLVAEQRRLMELLKEKRQAVISHAVTKGLNPHAPMKPSGIEWLGDVPEHWAVKPLRHLGRCQNGLNIGGDAFGSGFPFVSYGDVYKNTVLPSSVKGLVESSETDWISYSVQRGDVLFTRTSETIDEIGMASTCLETIPKATFAGFLIRFRPIRSLDCRFSKHYFSNPRIRAFFAREMVMITRASLSQDLLKRLPVLLPPESEQIEICDYLDASSAQFDTLTAEAQRAIDLLQERRTALISAAVTGQIDVRVAEAVP